jgi:hypothetical protein
VAIADLEGSKSVPSIRFLDDQNEDTEAYEVLVQLIETFFSQCARAGLVCLGYRTKTDLMFTDQTEKVTRKFQARQDRNNVSELATNTPAAGRNQPL